ncbi:MAG: UDP-3-O-(3-hydroxymyristoyl)glucosamine N-acyltransferase [Candidatus Thorarchaeota archaeon]|nr:UDP-3-O-(3-hydroxymyristoyl)glucosamine N-acyltransferase [Candidatus Thorarchaeota archaeon]
MDVQSRGANNASDASKGEDTKTIVVDMSTRELLAKYGVPLDSAGTCAIESLKARHVAYLASDKYLAKLVSNESAYVLVYHEILPQAQRIPGNVYVETKDPTAAFVQIHNSFHRDLRSCTDGEYKPATGKGCVISSTARFGKNVVLGDRVVIHPNVVIGSDVRIGDDTEVLPSATIQDRTTLGRRCIVESNACIGGDGFRIVRDEDGRNHRLVHLGGVVFGDDVEFGNCSCVDRGSFGNTVLGDRVKIDNLVHIGHNAQIGEDTQIAASSCIGGSTVIGKNCWVGIGATVSNGLRIGDRASVLINAVVTRDVPEGTTVAGVYAMPNDVWRLVMKDRVKRFMSDTQ